MEKKIMESVQQKNQVKNKFKERFCIEKFILYCIENSTTPFEKLNAQRFIQGQSVSETRFDFCLEEWRKNLTSDKTKEKIERFIRLSELHINDLHQMFAPAKLAEGVELPKWAEVLRELLTCQLKAEDIDKCTRQFEEISFLFLKVFLSRLNKELKFELSTELTCNALENIKSYFKQKSLEPLLKVLEYEFENFTKEKSNFEILNNCYPSFIKSILENNGRNLFYKYTMLARIVANDILCQVIFIKQFLNRLRTDKKEIENYFESKKIGKISHLKLEVGDAHHGGQSVIIVEFESGFKIVYKPRNIGVGCAYNSICQWVNTKLDIKLRILKIISKKEYGWVEYIDHLPCENEEEIKQYYIRAGIIVGLTYFLESTDYHSENVIANGSHPVLIDHETIINPYFDVDKSSVRIANKVDGIPLDSVLRSYLLPFKNNVIDNLNGCGLGGLLDAPNQKKTISNLPILDGSPKRILSYKKEVLKGFKLLYELVVKEKDYLISSKSPFRFLKNQVIRIIYRPTRVYVLILKSLLNPAYLKDSNKYGFRLELLARGYLKDNHKPNFWDILNEERLTMLDRDVPCVSLFSNSQDVFLNHNRPIKAHFESDCYSRILNKIRRSGIEDFQFQKNIIIRSLHVDSYQKKTTLEI